MEDGNAKDYWESRYNERAQIWSGRVNAVLEQVAGGLTPGRALDLGCGEGGDALWLAEHGWQVTAIDVSPTAVDRGAAEATRRGLSIDWQCGDLADGLPRGPFDLVSAQYLHSRAHLPRAEVLQRAAAEVAPGGTLLVVGHGTPPPWSEHYSDPSLTPSSAEVVAQLGLPEGEWELVRAEDVVRAATGPDGQAAELEDSIVMLRRRNA